MRPVVEAVEKVDNEYGKLEGVTLEQWVAWFVSVNVAYHAFLNAKQTAEKEAADENV